MSKNKKAELFLVLSLFVSLGSPVLAAEEDEILEDIKSTEDTPADHLPAPIKETDLHLDSTNVWVKNEKRFLISAFGGLSLDAFRMYSKEGFNSGLPPKRGSFFGTSFHFRPMNSSFGMFADYKRWRSKTIDIPVLRPDQITHRENYLRLGTSFFAFDSLPEFGINFGGYYRTTESTTTVPNDIMTDQYHVGVLLGAQYRHFVFDNFTIEQRLMLSTPVYFHEPEVKTGNHRIAFSSQYEVDFMFHLTRTLDLGFGGDFFIELHWFNGRNQRGALDAYEKRINILVPIKARLSF